MSARLVNALHEESLARFGGATGLRDEGLLSSALGRPRNLYDDEGETSVAALAAAYGYGLVRNHPFLDGNKRTALLSVAVFTALGGRRFEPDQLDEVRTMWALAAGELSESQFAQWVADNST